jgi:hypothetical protein
VNIYDDISTALQLAGDDASCIVIGWQAWERLKVDPRSMNCLTCVGDALFFKGVEIDPFSAEGVGCAPNMWEVV